MWLCLHDTSTLSRDVLQIVAECRRVGCYSASSQCVAGCCCVLQCVPACCSVLQCVAVCSSVFQCIPVCDPVCSSVFQCVACPFAGGRTRVLTYLLPRVRACTCSHIFICDMAHL